MRPRARSERALLGLLAAATAAGPVAVAIYLPVVPLVRTGFGVSVAAASTTVTLPLVAFALALLAWGPVSDHLGRRPAILAGLGINLAGSLLGLAAPTLPWLLAGRIVQAVGSAAGVTVARAALGDQFRHEHMARAIATLTVVMLFANSLAPVAGGLLGALAGWRSTFVVLAVGVAAVLAVLWRWLPETRGAAPAGARPLAAATALARMPAFWVPALLTAAVYAEFYVFVSLMPYVFTGALGHTTTAYGLWSLCVSGGYLTGNIVVSRVALRAGLDRLLTVGMAVTAVASLAALALVLEFGGPAPVLFLPWLPLAFGQGLALPALTARAIAVGARATGAASGLVGFTQQILSALVVQAMALAPATTPVPIVAAVAAIALAGLAATVATRRRRPVPAGRAAG